MRPALGLLLVLLGAAALSPWPSPGASASCAGPSISVVGSQVDPPELEPRTSIVVEGRGFVDGCDDNGTSDGGGCDNDEPREGEAPLSDVELTIRQGGHEWILGTADAGTAESDELGRVTWTFTLPTEVGGGTARLVPERGQAIVVLVR